MSDTTAVDTRRPTATITLADTALTAGEMTTVIFTFSEPVNGFTVDDIVLTNANGTLGTLTPNADRTVWTATFTPAANVNDTTNTVSVNMTGVTDYSGNAGVGNATSTNFTIDTRPADTTHPTATITLADTTLTAGETTTVTFTFSEPVSSCGFTAEDIDLSNANGTLGTLTANASRTVWIATFTPTANINDASNTISVDLTGVSDDAGNAGVGSASSANYTVNTRSADTTAPTATITLADTALTAGETTTVTFTFSEPVTGFTLDDVLLTRANGSLGPLMNLSGDGSIWYATFTAAGSNVHDPRSTISVNLAGVTNAAGSAGQGNASSASYTVDAVRPGASITLADSTLTAGETTTVSITFSERVTGFTRSNLVLDNAHGELGELVAGADGRTWSATFTPRADVERSTGSIGLNLSGITDAAGNPAQGPASASFTVDTMPPRATVTLARSALKAGQSSTVTFTFSESVTGFTAEDIVLGEANGSLGPLSSNADGSVWSATFTPNADTSDASNRIRVNLAGVTDRAGNVGLGFADSANYTVDTVRPGVTITLADNTLGAGEVTTVSFLFDKPVTGFTLEDIDLSNANGSLGGLRSSGDGRLWHAEFTPAANTEDASNTIRVNLAGVSDAAGNTGVGSASSANYRIDSVRPTVAITLADSSLTVGETTTVTFSFSEPVSDFNAGDIVLGDANGYLGPLSAAADGKTWTAIFTPRDNLNDATNTIGVNLAGVSDAAGNRGQGLASSANYRLDTRAGDSTTPTATITLSDRELKAGETSTVTIAFSKPVTGFDANDMVLTNANGTLGTLTANASRTVWTATFTPTANVNDATNTISVNLTGVSGDAGNAGVGSASSANFTVNTLRPTATITLADTVLTVGETTTVTFTFNEPVTGFDANDIVLTNANGTLGTLAANASRTVWTATFTPTANVNDATNTISVNLTRVSGDAGNAGVGSASSANFTVNTLRPTATITLADTVLTVGETTTVTFTFNEPVTGFDANDIVLTNANGTLGTLTANVSRTVWTATFTPAANVNGATNAISVNLTGVTDDAGNAGVGSASSANFTVDTTVQRPTVTITTLASTSLGVGQTTTVTITFSEPVTGFDASDIVLTDANGTLGPLTALVGGRVWTATFTPTADVEDSSNTIRVNLAGVTNAAGHAGMGHAISAGYAIDTKPPVLASATVTGNRLVLNYTEGTSLDAIRIPPTTAFTVRVNGAISTVTAVAVNASAKTVTLTLVTAVTSDQTVTLAYNDPSTRNDVNAIQDVAGNDAASFPAMTVRNTVPRTPTPTPDLQQPTSLKSDALDTDSDSVPDIVEDRVIGISGLGGAGPVTGDGNGDGIQDSTQAGVGSASIVISPTGISNPAGAASTSVTLVAGSQDGKIIPGSNACITSLVQQDAPVQLPNGLQMPLGLIRFEAALAAGRSSEKFSLYVDPGLGVNGYWVQDRTGNWVNLASQPYGGKMVREGERLRLDFQITDGGPFDTDDKLDGSITIPGAPAHMLLSIVGQAPDLAPGGFWF